MLQASTIHKRLGMQEVLRGVDLTLAPGESVAIFGANGAGKTTLIRILATLLHPDKGQVVLGGRSYADFPSQVRAQIGLIIHEPLGYLFWSPYQNLRFLGRMYGVADAESRIMQLLDYVGLLPYAHEPIRIFSRGMTQRFMVARALIHDPPLLLFDEPFSGLDLRGQQFLLKLLHQEKQRGKSILLTTHAPALGYEAADRYLALSQGRLTPLGDKSSLSSDQLEARYQEILSE